LLGFCDLENWDSIKLGFETLLKFSIDKRPKVTQSMFLFPLSV
jgi:ribosomal RNA-processing protein 12